MQEEKIGRNDPCWCGSGRKYKKCHEDFDRKIESYRLKGHIVPSRSMIKTPEQIEGIRISGKINIEVLDMVEQQLKAGMTTEAIDRIVHDTTLRLGGRPAPLGFLGYPKSVCASINEEVCHGIPSEEIILKDGDIINIDVSTEYKGYYSDSSRMYCIGSVTPEKKKLVQVTKECVQKGIKAVKPWGFLGDVGYVVHQHALNNGYTIVEEIGGHGIGLEFHEEPFVSFVTKPKTEMLMVPGMVFTIEPMLNMGTQEIYRDDENGWTIYTDDGLPSAQCEVTIVVTETGSEVLVY